MLRLESSAWPNVGKSTLFNDSPPRRVAANYPFATKEPTSAV